MKKTEFLLTGCKLNRDEHIQMICKKVASVITAIKRVRNFLPCETFLTIFRALLQPRFKYCSTVWANCNKGLQKVQNRAVRIITSLNYGASLDELILPGYQRFFSRFRCWPKADTSSAVGRSREKNARVTETVNRARKVSGTQGRMSSFSY